LIVIDVVTSPRSMPVEERLHVGERVDATPHFPTSPSASGVVGVVAHQRRQVERRRQARLPCASRSWKRSFVSSARCRSPRTAASSRACRGTCGGTGTFASFNAEVANNGNTFASGTLFLHETQAGNTACTSESDTTNNSFSGAGCNVLFNASSLTSGVQTAHLALNNNGTIPAADTKFNVTSCAFTVNTAGTGSAVTFGSAPACSDMYLTLQETDSTYTVPTTDVYCAFGPSAVQPDCDTPDNTATLTTAAGPSLHALLTTAAAQATIAPGATRYYVISILPNPTLVTANNGNRLQNRLLTFGMTWHIDQ
jgi:hypothetical protein